MNWPRIRVAIGNLQPNPSANLAGTGKGHQPLLKQSVVLLVAVVMMFAFAAGTASAATPLNEKIDALLGTPYKSGGSNEKGFDCSGFTSYVFAKFDIELTRTSRSQAEEGNWVAKEDLRPGDLVFFETGKKGIISHVGIYIGDNMFAHSASDDGVVKSSLDESYYKKRYVTARRIMWDDIYTQLTTEPAQ